MIKPETTKRKRISYKYRTPPLKFILDFYDAHLRESDFDKVCATLEVSSSALNSWTKAHEELQLAKKLADERRGSRNDFSGYIYRNLSPEARKVWKRIEFWESQESAYDKVREILCGKPKKLRQELFIHALVSSNFDCSTACRMVAIPRTVLDGWRKKEPDFRELVMEIQWHKKNFFEKALVDLVEQGHPGATIFVNRTINADRGYSEKLRLDLPDNLVGGDGLDIDELDLDVETKRKVLEAIRRKKNGNVIDGEVVGEATALLGNGGGEGD